ncbi:uncharacterized protein LOC110117461 isoform X2 [Athalia rosae]|uniref:uncharacterized protein LOC110117461 isoform X2 n=1 Tax=Athalia rosae TaxID=37344 RepID=UPI0020332A64|nr:uncharacterized protein LOC110117461 isoform X2 [Athalia rosae]XP_048513922.1 uncharacterized protein LOC110117461 isoform X2 [Athalia rosae]
MRNSPTSGATVTLRLIGRSIADFPRIRSAMCNRKGPLSRGTALIGRAICSEHHVYRESAKRVNNEAERGNFLLAKNMLFLKMNAAPGVSLFRATGKLHDKGRNEERPRGFPTDSRCDRHPAIASACRIRFRLLRSQCQGVFACSRLTHTTLLGCQLIAQVLVLQLKTRRSASSQSVHFITQ